MMSLVSHILLTCTLYYVCIHVDLGYWQHRYNTYGRCLYLRGSACINHCSRRIDESFEEGVACPFTSIHMGILSLHSFSICSCITSSDCVCVCGVCVCVWRMCVCARACVRVCGITCVTSTISCNIHVHAMHEHVHMSYTCITTLTVYLPYVYRR